MMFVLPRVAGMSGTKSAFTMVLMIALAALVCLPAVAVFPTPPGISQTTTLTETPGIAIPDLTTTTDTTTAAGLDGSIWDIDVVTSITHTFNGDLIISLTSPSGTVVTLSNRRGGGDDDVFDGTTWDDSAGDPVSTHVFTTNVTATPLTPDSALSAFVGEDPNGVWTLTVDDVRALDFGMLVDWSVVITTLEALPVTTSSPASSVNAGESVTFNVTITNSGLQTLTAVSVVDTLPFGVTFIADDASCVFTVGTGGGGEDQLTCALGDLSAGESRTISILVLIPADFLIGTADGLALITNTVDVSGSNLAGVPTTVGSVTVTESADLRITKIADGAKGLAGTPLNYSVVIENLGPSFARGVMFQDDFVVAGGLTTIPAVGLDVRDDSSMATITSAFAQLDEALEPVGDSGGGTGRWNLTITLNEADGLDIQDTATVFTGPIAALTWTSGTPDPNSLNNTAPGFVLLQDASDFAFTTATVAAAANAGETLQYVLTVTNGGPSAADNVTLSAKLPAGVSVVSVTSSAGTCNAGTPGDPSDPTTCNVGTLASAATGTMTIDVLISPSVGAGTVLIANASASSDSFDPDNSDNFSSLVTTVAASADVSASLTDVGGGLVIGVDAATGAPILFDSATAVTAGKNIRFGIQVVNAGPSDAQNVQVSVELPQTGGNQPLAEFVSVEGATCGPVDVFSNTTICSVGTIPAGGQINFTVITHILEDVADATVITTRITALDSTTAPNLPATPDPGLGNNVVSHFATVSADIDLGITKTIDAPTPTVGQEVTYTITVTNNGPSLATGVTIADTLPAEVIALIVTDTDCALAGNVLSCTITSLAPGESRTFDVIADVVETLADGTAIANTATVTATEADFNAANDSATANAIVELVDTSDLEVTAHSADVATATTGDAITYTIVVTNNGPDTAENVVVSDNLPAEVELTSITSTVGSCIAGTPGDPNDPSLCAVGTLLSGASATITIVTEVVVSAGAGDPLIFNDVSVSADGFDPETGNNVSSTGVTLTGTGDANLAITKMADVAAAADGDIVTYTITVTNNGPSAARNVVIEDFMPAELAITAITSDSGSCTAGTPGDPSDPARCIAGTLAFGASVEITITGEMVLTGGSRIPIVYNDATTSSDHNDPDLSDNLATVGVMLTGIGISDLRITKFGKPDGSAEAGEVLTYTIIVDNLGPDPANNVAVLDVLRASAGVGGVPATFDILDFTSDRPMTTTIDEGTKAARFSLANLKGVAEVYGLYGGASITALLDAPLEVLDPTVPGSGRWILTMMVTSDEAMSINNVADVISESTDPNFANNHALVQHEITEVSDLSITQVADPVSVDAGDDITYTLTITNNGPSSARNVMIEDRLPAEVLLVSITPSVGSCSAGTPGDPFDPIVCGLGTLLVDQVETIIVVVRVTEDTAPGLIFNDALVTSPNFDSNNSNNIASAGVTVGCEAPVVTLQPANQDICYDTVATFTAAASGIPTPDIQWQVNNGSGNGFVDLLDETNGTLTLTYVPLDSDRNVYRARFTNTCGTTFTDDVVLIVSPKITVTVHPEDLEVCVDTTAVFRSLAVGGRDPVTIQWQVDDGSGYVDVGGANANLLTLDNVTDDMNGNFYRAVFSDLCGATTSNEAKLTVIPLPEIPLGQDAIVFGPAPHSDTIFASDGQFIDRIRVTWMPVAGADEYRVFRSELLSFADAIPVSVWMTDLVFDDFDVNSFQIRSGLECNFSFPNRSTIYFYQVLARNMCGESNFSDPDRGWARLEPRTLVVVVPTIENFRGNQVLSNSGPISIRLVSSSAINLDSIWSRVTSDSLLNLGAFSVVPNVPGNFNDVWVIFDPLGAWKSGEIISMAVGAETIDGKTLDPVLYRFEVEDGAEKSADIADGVGLVTAPDAPVDDNAVGGAYSIVPEIPFGTAVSVLLPVPDGVNPEDLSAFVLLDGAWIPGEHVEGWLAEGSDYTVTYIDGQAYLGMFVNHSAVVELGYTTDEAPLNAGVAIMPATAGSVAGDLLLLAAALLLLLVRGIGIVRSKKA